MKPMAAPVRTAKHKTAAKHAVDAFLLIYGSEETAPKRKARS